MSISPRRSFFHLGETVLLWAFSVPILGHAAVLEFLAEWDPAALGNGDWLRVCGQALLIPLACQVSFSFQDLYEWRVTANRDETALRLLSSCFYAGLLLVALNYGLQMASGPLGRPGLLRYALNPWAALVCLVVALPLSYAWRRFFHWSAEHWSLRERVLLLGKGAMARTLEEEILHQHHPGYEIVGHVGPNLEGAEPLRAPDLGPVDDLGRIAARHKVHRIVVTMSERRGQLPTIALLNCRLAGIRIENGEDMYERITGKVTVERMRPSHLIFAEGFESSKLTHAVKRLLDVVLALVGIAVLSPFCLLVALAIKLDSRGSVFYGQARVGKDGRVFTTYKFRTMRADAEAAGPRWAAENDDRVTRVGRMLRRTRIDELPQMWNVLRNEMSFVGPRPERPFFVAELRQQIPYYTERLLVKPGITGWAQINYQYGSSVNDALTKLQYDLYYIKHLSIFLDLLTLMRTVKVVILRRGAV